MRRTIAVLGSLLAAGFLGVSAAQAAVSINIGSATGDPGQTVDLSVSLTANAGELVAGTQNDFGFDASTPIARRANGRPDCAVNPAIEKGGTSFAFRPAGCTAETCTEVRSLVLATDNTDPIPDGSVLYTCKVAISATATGGEKAVPITGVIASDPSGTRITGATGNAGSVTVSGGGEPSPTPTQPSSACDPVRPAPAGPAVYVEDLNLEAAGDAVLETKLATGNAVVAGTQSDMSFGGNVVVKRRANGRPDCAVNPAIEKGGTSFAFRPAGCAEGACTEVRALVLATDNTDPIPDGSVLFTCNVTVTAPGATMSLAGIILSDPSGTRVDGATGREGVVCVGGGAEPTPTSPPSATCAAVRPAPAGPAVYVQDLNLEMAGAAVLETKLATSNAVVAGTQSDMSFGGSVIVNRRANGRPDCTVNPAIEKGGTSFAFRPAGCAEGACTEVRALVLATDNTDPIPDGSVLFTCNVTVTSPGSTLSLAGVILSDPSGTRIPDATGRDGVVCVEGAIPTPPTPATATVTPTTPAPVTPPTATVTATRAVTATATASRTATGGQTGPTHTPGGLEDEGGCHIAASSTHGSGWMLLVPLAAFLMIRRRSR